jgi:ligand-binding sensor domain-containing protein
VYTTENSGLPFDMVHELAFDQVGLLWIGLSCFYCQGSGGLASFDGENWTSYDSFNSGIPDDQVIGLALDEEGHAWVGTSDSLGMFDGENWIDFARTGDSTELRMYDIPGIDFDLDGRVWVSSADTGGIAYFDGESWTRFTLRELPVRPMMADDITVDHAGNKWIGTRKGLVKFDGDKWTVFDTENSGLPSSWIWVVLVDDKENVWIGMSEGGLAVYREGGVDLDLVE